MLLLLLTGAAALDSRQQLEIWLAEEERADEQYALKRVLYQPTHFVRLMAVATFGRNTPFLTAMVTTKDDRLVIANIPNGDPPTAFNVTEERGFQAPNGKYIFFDAQTKRVRLDDNPHNETQYLPGGAISTTNWPNPATNFEIWLCPESGSIYSIGFLDDCGLQWQITLYPIPPQSLTGLWENTTRYPLAHQRGWLDSNMTNVTLGDNSTFNPTHAALGKRFRPPVDRSIEPTDRIRFYAVSISWPCPWLSALVVPVGDKLKVGAFTSSAVQHYFSYSEDAGFRSNNNEYLYLDPEAHSLTLEASPHPEVVWRNGTVAYKVGGEEGNVTYGAALAACPVSGSPFQYSIEYNSSCTGGHRVQLRAVGPGGLTNSWSGISGQDETPHGSVQDRSAAKKGSASFEKRDLEGSLEFEEKLRLRLMGLID
ncbi:hypothetical protein CJU89_4608 [Yarrowia sp. B02]|nr:hypothetical protein CJU89_4608 [Yarrowia sp. B02]